MMLIQNHELSNQNTTASPVKLPTMPQNYGAPTM